MNGTRMSTTIPRFRHHHGRSYLTCSRSAVFDEPNLVALAGLVAVMALIARAARAGLAERLIAGRPWPVVSGLRPGAEGIRVGRGHGTGADSIADMAVVRHTGNAVIQQIIADLKDGPVAQFPSGSFAASTAWLVLAAMASTSPRRRCPGRFHAGAVTATVRATDQRCRLLRAHQGSRRRPAKPRSSR